MKLNEYLKQQKLKMSDMAKDFNVVHCVVRRWCIGEVIPSEENMKKIVVWTGGKVTPNDFYMEKAI